MEMCGGGVGGRGDIGMVGWMDDGMDHTHGWRVGWMDGGVVGYVYVVRWWDGWMDG